MADLAWLRRPFAHRGLHDAARGIVENTASAFQAAIDADYGIELDLREAADGTPMVFHDCELDRLTLGSGPVKAMTARGLAGVHFKATSDRMQTLAQVLVQVAGRVPILIEIKSDWGPRGRFERRIGALLCDYRGPVAVMSFDPASMAVFRAEAPQLPRGLVAERFRSAHHWGGFSRARRAAMRHLLTAFMVRPHFIAYDVQGLPALAPWAARAVFRLPLLTWTVRNEAQARAAERWADAVIFEQLRP